MIPSILVLATEYWSKSAHNSSAHPRRVLLGIRVHPIQTADALHDEFFWVEIHRVARSARPLADVGQNGQRKIIGDEDVQPPACGVGLQMIEAPVTMFDQSAANALTVGIDGQTMGTSRPRRSPLICVAGGGRHRTVLRPWEADGAEASDQGGIGGHRACI
jgi:hypothetical protein